MRLFFLNRFFYPDHSATSQMLSDLAFGLAAQGHEVNIITSRQRYDAPDARLAPYEDVNGVRVHRVRTPRFGRANLLGRALDYLGFYVAASTKLLRLVRSGDVVIAKTDPPLISVPAALVARLRGARLINWLQDLFPEVAAALGIRGLPYRMLSGMRDGSLRKAQANVVIGERMAERLRNRGIPAERIVLIHNWADGKAIQPVAVADNPLRHDWQLADKFVVGYSGNLGRAHEFDTILQAAALLADDRGIRFLFIGDGAQAQMVRQSAKQRGLDNIVFRPYQPREQLRHSLAAADVHLVVLKPELEGLIVPSKYYGIAAAGRPAIFIGDGAGEIARILKHSDSGQVVNTGDAAALAAVIRELRDPLKRQAMGERARALFEQEFQLPIALGRWDALLRTGYPTPADDEVSGS